MARTLRVLPLAAALVAGTIVIRGSDIVSTGDAELQFQIASVLFDENRYDEAIAAFDRVAKADDPALSVRARKGKVRAELRIAYVQLPGTLEGGDVLRIGRKFFVGLTKRSNAEGIRQFAEIIKPHGYEVISVPVTGCLHLKSAVTFLGDNTLLANRAWFDTAPFGGYDWIDVDPSEPHAANALALSGTVVFPASFPKTRRRIGSLDFPVTPLDISELQKAESGLTCSSLLFESFSG